jgi:hypothetical protein
MIASTARAAHRDTEGSAPVRACVRRVWRAQVLRRAIESFLIGVAAVLVCLAASVASGAREFFTAIWVASGAVGWLAASSWWLEHAPTEASVARRLDGDGALITAYEFEVSGSRSRLQSLLSRRVVAELAHSGRRIARTPSALMFAILLAAGALFALTLESGPTSSSRLVDARRSTLAERARALVAAADHDADALSADTAGDVRELVSTAATLATTRTSERQLADFAARADRAALDQAGHPRVQEALDAAASAARDLSSALAGNFASRSLAGPDEQAAAASDPSNATSDRASGRVSDGARDRVARQPSATASEEPNAVRVGDSGTDMRDGSADVTMLRPHLGPASDAAANVAAERGLSGVRWWPRRFDAIVERWVEHQRASSDR